MHHNQLKHILKGNQPHVCHIPLGQVSATDQLSGQSTQTFPSRACRQHFNVKLIVTVDKYQKIGKIDKQQDTEENPTPLHKLQKLK